MGNEPDELEPSSPEDAVVWLEEASGVLEGFEDAPNVSPYWIARRDNSRAYLLKWATHGQERQGMMSRLEGAENVLRYLDCAEDVGPYVGEFAVAQLFGVEALYDLYRELDLAEKAEREAEADAQ